MILIISESTDHNTNEVIQWLIHNKARFIRINRGDRLSLQKMQITNGKSGHSFTLLSKRNGEINLDEITAVWYRRGELHFQLPNLNFIQNTDLKRQIYQHLMQEKIILEDFLQYLLYAIPHVGTYKMRGVNKLIVLDQARKLGIEIPDTTVISEKKQLNTPKKLIAKSISEVFSPTTEAGRFIAYRICESLGINICIFSILVSDYD